MFETGRMVRWEGWCDVMFLECGMLGGRRRLGLGGGWVGRLWGGLRRRALDGEGLLVIMRVMRFLWEWKDVKVFEMLCCDLFEVWDCWGKESNINSLK